MFTPNFYANNHQTAALEQDFSACWNFEHTVPRCFDISSAEVRTAIYSIINLGPFSALNNVQKGDAFELGVYDSQMCLVTLHFLYALTESVLPCAEFDDCTNLASVIERAQQAKSSGPESDAALPFGSSSSGSDLFTAAGASRVHGLKVSTTLMKNYTLIWIMTK